MVRITDNRPKTDNGQSIFDAEFQPQGWTFEDHGIDLGFLIFEGKIMMAGSRCSQIRNFPGNPNQGEFQLQDGFNLSRKSRYGIDGAGSIVRWRQDYSAYSV